MSSHGLELLRAAADEKPARWKAGPMELRAVTSSLVEHMYNVNFMLARIDCQSGTYRSDEVASAWDWSTGSEDVLHRVGDHEFWYGSRPQI